jgi:hypothetical protein
MREAHETDAATPVPIPTPVAWIFELATTLDKSTGKRGGWCQCVQFDKPHMPPDAIRNLRPLYSGDYVPLEATLI